MIYKHHITETDKHYAEEQALSQGTVGRNHCQTVADCYLIWKIFVEIIGQIESLGVYSRVSDKIQKDTITLRECIPKSTIEQNDSAVEKMQIYVRTWFFKLTLGQQKIWKCNKKRKKNLINQIAKQHLCDKERLSKIYQSTISEAETPGQQKKALTRFSASMPNLQIKQITEEIDFEHYFENLETDPREPQNRSDRKVKNTHVPPPTTSSSSETESSYASDCSTSNDEKGDWPDFQFPPPPKSEPIWDPFSEQPIPERPQKSDLLIDFGS